MGACSAHLICKAIQLLKSGYTLRDAARAVDRASRRLVCRNAGCTDVRANDRRVPCHSAGGRIYAVDHTRRHLRAVPVTELELPSDTNIQNGSMSGTIAG